MGPWDNFRLVVGYLPQIDEFPETARKRGLVRRVAAVLNDDDAPHSQVYWALLEAFVDSLAHDSVIFEIDTDSEPLVFTSIATMRQHVEASASDFGRPFNRATFFARGRATAFIDVEPWAMGGGPMPYSDSWTFAMYRQTNDITRLRESCYRVCMQYGLPILEEMQGLDAPVEQPRWWQRLVQIVRREKAGVFFF